MDAKSETARWLESCEGNCTESLLNHLDILRVEAYQGLDPRGRAKLGQFSTSSSIARLMASMLSMRPQCIKILDAGAGVGSLSAALVAELYHWEKKPNSVSVIAYEIEPTLIYHLQTTLGICAAICKHKGIEFVSDIFGEDFIEASVALINNGFLSERENKRFNLAIINPPYRKIRTDSRERRLLKLIDIETSNLYTAFLWIAIKLLEPGGELVAITPRSFCNGPYFRSFRKAFFNSMTLRRIHIFESREEAFRVDDVLQESIIIHAVKSTDRSSRVAISSSFGPDDMCIECREVDHNQLVQIDDLDAIIHIISDETAYQIRQHMTKLDTSLKDLDISVSTGRVVDFRAKKENLLKKELTGEIAPLIYAAHFSGGYIKWPNQNFKKPTAIIKTQRSYNLLVPAGFYVLVKRFSSKEELRRVVAAVYDPNKVPASMIGFENHLNYYHRNGQGIPAELAKGLATFLNSTIVDQYFRQFSGHTQINATDLRSLRYPSAKKLISLGSKIDVIMQQDEIDRLVNEELNISSDFVGLSGLRARKDLCRSPDPPLKFKRILGTNPKVKESKGKGPAKALNNHDI